VNYAGYLIKIGGTALPLKYMRVGTYVCTPDQRISAAGEELDANGVAHRVILANRPTRIEFSTPSMDIAGVQEFNTIIKAGITNADERRIPLEYYNPDTDAYATADFHMPDVVYTIARAIGSTLWFEPLTLAFIGY
jgi:hypothetical protein